ncbi:MAG: HIT family protein [Burkholderiaceae bacterium]
MSACPLCNDDGGELLVTAMRWRIVLADEPGWPGFARVIWNDHVAEMTDLQADHRRELMEVLFELEALMRATLAPDKINLASLGNQVPHLHWHLIPRHRDDSHFPAPIWAAPVRAGRAADPARLAAFRAAVAARFA